MTEVLRKRAIVSLTATETLIFVIVSCLSKSVNLLMVLIKLSLIKEIVHELKIDKNVVKACSFYDCSFPSFSSFILFCHCFSNVITPIQTHMIVVVPKTEAVPLQILM